MLYNDDVNKTHTHIYIQYSITNQPTDNRFIPLLKYMIQPHTMRGPIVCIFQMLPIVQEWFHYQTKGHLNIKIMIT